MQIEDFYSEESAWKASVSATGGEISQLKAYLEAITEIKKPVVQRDRMEDLTSRGLVVYVVSEKPKFEKLQAFVAGKQQQDDFALEMANRINLEQPVSWKELAEVLEEDMPMYRSLAVLLPQQEHAEKLAEALSQAGATDINLVTLERSSKKGNISQRKALKPFTILDKGQPWLWKCFKTTPDDNELKYSFTPSWAHPKVVDRMAQALDKLAKEESWTGDEKQVTKGIKAWEDVASKEGIKLVPDAACTFYLRETHLDGLKAAQHLTNQPAKAEDFFPPQVDKLTQEKP